MDRDTNLDAAMAAKPATDDSESVSRAGGFFSGSKHFTIAGGTFTSITKNYPTAPDFRRIPLGDIDLQHEIHLDNTFGVVDRQRARTRNIRRVYSAKTAGRSVTVAMYQGNTAEEEWRQDIAKYMVVRHPNIVQLCGAATSGDVHATIFHDELIPLEDFVAPYRQSPLSVVYIKGYTHLEFKAAEDYFRSIFQRELVEQCSFCIRRSTGRFCVDLVQGQICIPHYPWSVGISYPQRLESVDVPTMEATIIDSMTLDQYHNMCHWDLSCHRTWIPALALVNLGAVICRPSGNETEEFIEIASLPNVELDLDACCWCMPGRVGDVMEDGWTRFASGDAAGTTVWLWVESPHTISWLSQANYIFRRLGISRDFEDYAVLDSVTFELVVSNISVDPPKGFLFLCPPRDFQSGTTSLKWPDCSAYWSLHPSGAERFSMEDAVNFGFPHVQLTMTTMDREWHVSTCVYAGLRQFHKAKGFDPDTQDVARHLGQPLYRLLDEVHGTFSRFEDVDSSSEDSDENTVYAEDEPEQKQTSTTKDHLIDAYWPDKKDIYEHQSSNMTTSAGVGHKFSASEPTWGGEEPPRHGPRGELSAVSRAFKILRYIQLALVLFLALSWLYDRM